MIANLPSDFQANNIAIIGIACRFAGAKNSGQFWQNLTAGVESVTFFSQEELKASGMSAETLENPDYVRARAYLEGREYFDPQFFGISPKEAQITDPQQRIFLEVAWEALEDAGYNLETYPGSIGVYGGANISNYYIFNICSNPQLVESMGMYATTIGNAQDFLTTRVSYRLNLTGPSITVQTACSTSLVAVHLAVQSLLNYECDMALAGGVNLGLPQKSGYLSEEGSVLSPDGHCRAFDARGQGMVPGEGAGIVLLKRLEDALSDRDRIYAVIKGSAVNNDGSAKIGYTAPSVGAQAEVIAMAQAVAEVKAETISYIETHGTGTKLGDPIEIAALSQVFRASTSKKHFCAVGSVKTNIGHTNTAAGVAGLIKTALALKYKQIPPSLNFETPNPEIDWQHSPFYLNHSLQNWQGEYPRRAGVSSFGMGGTNAHVILQEAPPLEPPSPSRHWQLLILSARTETALERATTNLIGHLQQHPQENLADVAYTCQVGRQEFNYRRVALCQNREDAIATLSSSNSPKVAAATVEAPARQIVFTFPGQGCQYVNMARELYDLEPTFRQHVDHCCELLKPHLNLDLRAVIYPDRDRLEVATGQIRETAIAQPALFVIEYALAQLWLEWGIAPQAMIGHSIGEYVAATLAGVFSLEDALKVVSQRGKLMQAMPQGEMLAVPLPESELLPLLPPEISLAVINAPNRCVVSGTNAAIEQLQAQLTQKGVGCRRLFTSHGFHSAMMDEVLAPFTAEVAKIKLNTPKIPYISNLTGTWIAGREASDPNYYASHLRQTVRFADGIGELCQKSASIFLEVGPGNTLSALTKQQSPPSSHQFILASLRHPHEQKSDLHYILHCLGRLWLAGVKINWTGFYRHEKRDRLPLPTYPFERQRYWIEPQTMTNLQTRDLDLASESRDISNWFYLPSWQESAIANTSGTLNLTRQTWLVFVDQYGLGKQIIKQLNKQNQTVIQVNLGDKFAKIDEREYCLNCQNSSDYCALIQDLRSLDAIPERIVHLWTLSATNNPSLTPETITNAQDLGFYSLTFLAQALEKHNLHHPIQIQVVSNSLYKVNRQDLIAPEKRTILGPCQVIPQEFPHISCRNLDIVLNHAEIENLSQLIIAEIDSQSSECTIAYRQNNRYIPIFQPIKLNSPTVPLKKLRAKGVYLITGGLGNIGLLFAEYLAQKVQGKLVLVGRSAFPARNEWLPWLNTHPQGDPISCKIKKIQNLEKLGSEVLILSADVADEKEMQQVIHCAEQKFGHLNGVIHSAGIIGDEAVKSISAIGIREAELHFQAKVFGLITLAKVLQGKQLDFCVLQSSLSSILGGLGFTAYAAANLFMDAFARQNYLNDSIPWQSINWEGWQFGKEKHPHLAIAKSAMKPEEGIAAWERILSLENVPQIVVSTTPLAARINQWIKRESPPERAPAGESEPISIKQQNYVAPRDEIEQTLCDIWQELLGIEQVGIHDDWFDLGGDSLMATRFIARIKEAFAVQLPVLDVYENRTIANLAILILQAKAQQIDEETLSQLLAELEEGETINRQ